MRLLEVLFAVWRHKDALTSRVYLWVVTFPFQDNNMKFMDYTDPPAVSPETTYGCA